MHIVCKLFSKDQQTDCASREAHLVVLYSREWLECGARSTAAVRAMAVQCVGELVCDGVLDLATQALSSKRANRIHGG